MALTAEIHDANGNYAGYAKFDRNGNYAGSAGGYGTRTNRRNAPNGRGTTDMGGTPFNGGLRMQGNAGNRASVLQNTIRTAGIRGRRRNPYS